MPKPLLALAFRTLPAVLLLLVPAAAGAQSWAGDTALTLELEDDRGDAVAGAQVRLSFVEVEPMTGPPPTFSNSRGEAQVIRLAEGRWRLDVTREGFSNLLVVVRLEAGKKPVITAGPIRDAVAPPMKIKFLKSPKAGQAPPAVEPFAMTRRAPMPEPEPAPQPVPDAVKAPEAPSTDAPGTTSEPPAPPAEPEPAEPKPADREPAEAMAPEPPPAPTPPPPAPMPPPVEPESEPPPAPEVPTETPVEPPAEAIPVPTPEPAPEPAVPEAPIPEEAAPPAPSEPPAQPSRPAQPEQPARPAQPQQPAQPMVPEPSPPPVPPVIPSPGRSELRSFTEASCPGCKTGEWALTLERSTAAASGAGCPRNNRDLEQALQDMAEAAGPNLARDPGPLAFSGSVPAEIAPYLDPASSCQLLAVSLPPETKYSGYRYAVRDTDDGGDCQAGEECGLGEARWSGHPGLVKTDHGTVVWGLFENSSRTRVRQALFIVYLQPERGWRPGGAP